MSKKTKKLDDLFREKLNSDKKVFYYNKHDWELLEQKIILKRKAKRNVILMRALLGAAAVLVLYFSFWKVKIDQTELESDQRLLSTETDKIDSLAGQSGQKMEKYRKGEDLRNSTTHSGDQKTFANWFEKSRDSVRLEKSNKIALDSRLLTGIQSNQSLSQLKSIQLPKKELIDLIHDDRLMVSTLPFDLDRPKNNQSRRNVTLSVHAAPSLNSVGSFKNGEFGGDLGFLVSVNLTKRLKISTGAIYAKKTYGADFNSNSYSNVGSLKSSNTRYSGDYNPSEGYNMLNPQAVYADCRVLDIPLNIEYSLLNKGKNELSVGTGLSSYIMMRETYQFQYDDQASASSKTIDIRNENKHLMSIVNLQVSYTRKLNSRFGISVEPFLKIPVTDIGYGKIKLQSVGVALNVNFTLKPKNF